MLNNKLKIGTRGSKLALTQAELFSSFLSKHKASEIITFTTSGDKKQKLSPDTARDKKEWIIELEHGLLNKEIDIAIHSSKDVPIDIETQTILLPVLKRENPYDVIILSKSGRDKIKSKLAEVDQELCLGTSSVRRALQLEYLNPKIKCKKIRGNIDLSLIHI